MVGFALLSGIMRRSEGMVNSKGGMDGINGVILSEWQLFRPKPDPFRPGPGRVGAPHHQQPHDGGVSHKGGDVQRRGPGAV